MNGSGCAWALPVVSGDVVDVDELIIAYSRDPRDMQPPSQDIEVPKVNTQKHSLKETYEWGLDAKKVEAKLT